MGRILRAIGLMSGTSMDGVDVTLIESDGQSVARRGEGLLLSYDDEHRATIERAIDAASSLTDRSARPGPVAQAEAAVTRAHTVAVRAYLKTHDLAASDIDVIGFHGQTLLHRPESGLTIQIGDGEMLAKETGIDVVYDMRANDMAHGGQGAPLAPVYHRALVFEASLKLPLAVVNIGGVANVTWIGANGEMTAFDTGPGNALLDDWMSAKTDQAIDTDGLFAQAGSVDEQALQSMLKSSYFIAKPPKSLDRNDFSLEPVNHLNIEDGAATLMAFTVHALAGAVAHMPAQPNEWIICGGGARNPAMMALLKKQLGARVRSADELGWSGEFMEAEAFAFLAIRSLHGLPLTFPGTTGVLEPATGGTVARC